MKKKLLIYWVTRTFVEVIQPLIPKLNENFNIVVMLYNTSSMSSEFTKQLKILKDNGLIEQYIITPEHKNLLNFHLFFRSIIPELKSKKFDLWLSGGEMQVGERYVLECILPAKCITVCMWQNITYLFMYYPSITKRLASGGKVVEYHSARELPNANSSIQRIIEKIKQRNQLFKTFKIYLRVNYFKMKKKFRSFCDRNLFPMLMIGKVFRLGPFDEMTQLSSGRVDALIFFDDLEAKTYKKLLMTPKVFTARYPSYGKCHCDGMINIKKSILSPLSGFEGRDKITEEVLFLFYRDFSTVLAKTNAKKIHLRLHPNETGSWPHQLHNYLLERGMDASLVDSERPISEIMCDYIGIAGYASAALRDARASCDYALVIGFVGISSFQFSNPKQVFASSEGIDWIEQDGSYDPDIFTIKKYVPPLRKSVPEILMDLNDSNELKF